MMIKYFVFMGGGEIFANIVELSIKVIFLLYEKNLLLST